MTPEPGGADGAATILVADDEPANRALLRQVLSRGGSYHVLEAVDGVGALDHAAGADTILLDVMMPGMDGFEVCRRLKGDPGSAPVPIILVTSLDGREDRLRGVEAGADDFLVKPIDPREVLLRVRNAVRMHRLYREVQDSYGRLRELERLRDSLTHMLVHDFRSPLQSILGYGRLLQMDAGERMEPDDRDSLDRLVSCAEHLTEMVSATLDVSRMEGGSMPLRRERADLAEVARGAAAHVAGLFREKPVRVEAAEPVPAWCDPEIARRVLVNLLANALKFNPRGEEVVLRVEPGARAEVSDRGPGIPEEDRHRIFDKFVQLRAFEEGGRHSSGLGLTFCQMAVQAHGGSIGVAPRPGGGSTFWIELPPEEP